MKFCCKKILSTRPTDYNIGKYYIKWCLIPDEIKDYLVHKSEFTKLIRKQKLNKLHEIYR